MISSLFIADLWMTFDLRWVFFSLSHIYRSYFRYKIQQYISNSTTIWELCHEIKTRSTISPVYPALHTQPRSGSQCCVWLLSHVLEHLGPYIFPWYTTVLTVYPKCTRRPFYEKNRCMTISLY